MSVNLILEKPLRMNNGTEKQNGDDDTLAGCGINPHVFMGSHNFYDLCLTEKRNERCAINYYLYLHT